MTRERELPKAPEEQLHISCRVHGTLKKTTATASDGDEDEDAGQKRERGSVPKTWKPLGLEGTGNLASTA